MKSSYRSNTRHRINTGLMQKKGLTQNTGLTQKTGPHLKTRLPEADSTEGKTLVLPLSRPCND
ncbi:hypothetical protein K239x_13110 [Planctomycetes bacterium K23_9]|uniref:Uncharacterized protein n=1 Tax=Stieleria marina TaxID=1930275 RepID=A0A517NQH7_9BACT|nr:hypothetical protein K239x_13110 [Planctomycetes bacterium K23_9]